MIDFDKLEALGQYTPTDAEIALHLEITEAEAAEMRRSDPDFQAALARGEARRNLMAKKGRAAKNLTGPTEDLLKAEGDRRLQEYMRALGHG